MIRTNLVYILQGDQVLLAMKKRSHGVGKWNGPGGKVHNGESMKEAACREVKEEVGLTIFSEDLNGVGVIEFVYNDHPDVSSCCSIFLTRTFSGEPSESEEMRPKWFSIGALPWEQMWESDHLWLLDALNGRPVHYRFLFDQNNVLQATEKSPPR